MSSPLQLTLTSVQEGDYMSLVVLIAVAYDYILTIPKEVDYIWSKPWTWVSTLFLFVRYFGLLSYTVPMLSEIFVIAYGWFFALFLCPADFVMILRVWVIYNRSRLILCALLALLFFEIISMVLAAAAYSNPRNVSVNIMQVLDVSFCVVPVAPYAWTYVTTVVQVSLGAAMCILVIAQFVKQTIRIYHATRQWQLNKFVSLIVKEGVLYFCGILLYNIVNTLWVLGKAPEDGWQMTLLFIIEFVPLYTLPPRFILSIRELCTHDSRGGYDSVGIDSGFGLSSSPIRGAVGTRMSFAVADENEGLEVEEIQMEPWIISGTDRYMDMS